MQNKQYTIKVIGRPYNPYRDGWFFLYNEDHSFVSGKNSDNKIILKSYREALDIAKNMCDTYGYEVKILRL